jgi:predicted outer membrane repeat protein
MLLKDVFMKHRSLSFVGLILFVFPLLVLPQRQTLAATMTASTPLELAGAISLANGAAGADTILLASDIYLDTASVSDAFGKTGLPYIQSQITIDGQGHSISRGVGSSDLFRLFVVQSGSLTLINVMLEYGYSGSDPGGAIFNSSTLNLVHTTISNSRTDNSSGAPGGAIYNAGTLNITNSSFFNNYANNSGGAVYSDAGTVTITNSVFNLNSALGGGGAVAANTGTTTITNSSFASNNADFGGGAIFVSQSATLNISGSTLNNNISAFRGGGIYNIGTLNVGNSTFSDNFGSDAGGGIGNGVDTFGHSTINHSTFFHNQSNNPGGGVAVTGGSATINNSIIVVNSAIGGACYGTLGDNNLTDIMLTTLCGGFNLVPDMSILIGGLTNNGGPTLTHPVTVDYASPVDAATTSYCTAAPVSSLDQRGVRRGIDGDGISTSNECDIGAYEFGGNIRTLQFASAASSITPGGVTTLPVSVSLDAPLEAGYAPVTAYIWASGGTAVAGTHYTPIGVQTVTFNPGDQTKTVTLKLANSSLSADRTIILSFATQNGPGFNGPAKLGTQITHTITLKASGATAAPVRYYTGTRTIALSWTPVSWASGYEIQVDTDAGFAAPRVYENTSLSAGTLSDTVTVPGNGTYYWRVRAKQANGTHAPTYGPVQTFVVAGT